MYNTETLYSAVFPPEFCACFLAYGADSGRERRRFDIWE
ncbi:hypothetical protein l13_14380 [Neisseria weaveri ATCC 51223]|nr:hypothetical protein l13_14380 [Neisseria weaveri ATCC 51223]